MAPLRRGAPLKVAVIGVLAAQKGANAVVTFAEAADPEAFALHLIGHPEVVLPPLAAERIVCTGRYREADLPGLIAQVRPHVVWFPAQWPETFSYTLSAALEAGLPIVATSIGAFPERLEGRPLTWLRAPNSTCADWLATFGEVRTALQSVRPRRAPAVPRRSADDYYAEAYPAVLHSKGTATGQIDLRRPGRLSAVVVPETFHGGAPTPCAYIRLLQPLDHPAIGSGIDVVLADAATALDYRADMIVTQRYAVPDVGSAARLAAHCRKHGIALLYDLDDDLLNIPPEHPEYGELMPKADVVRAMLAAANAVWVSTEPLRARLAEAGYVASVVENALDERIWSKGPASRPPVGPLRVVYMGTATHDDDYAAVEPALGRLIEASHGRIGFDLVGVSGRPGLPGWVNRVSPSIHGTASYPGFVNWAMQDRGWDIGIAPLVDTPFNKCKSAIKALDYAALGLPVLASDVSVFRGSLADGPGGMLVTNAPSSWYAALALLAGDPVRRQRLAEGGRAAFLARHTLAAQAETRRAAWHALPGAALNNQVPIRRVARRR